MNFDTASDVSRNNLTSISANGQNAGGNYGAILFFKALFSIVVTGLTSGTLSRKVLLITYIKLEDTLLTFLQRAHYQPVQIFFILCIQMTTNCAFSLPLLRTKLRGNNRARLLFKALFSKLATWLTGCHRCKCSMEADHYQMCIIFTSGTVFQYHCPSRRAISITYRLTWTNLEYPASILR